MKLVRAIDSYGDAVERARQAFHLRAKGDQPGPDLWPLSPHSCNAFKTVTILMNANVG